MTEPKPRRLRLCICVSKFSVFTFLHALSSFCVCRCEALWDSLTGNGFDVEQFDNNVKQSAAGGGSQFDRRLLQHRCFREDILIIDQYQQTPALLHH